MTAPTSPLDTLSYNDQVAAIKALGLSYPEKRDAPSIRAVLQAHLDGGGQLPGQASPAKGEPLPAGTIIQQTITCPGCRGTRLNNYGSTRLPNGRRRYYTCLHCGRNFKIILKTPTATR